MATDIIAQSFAQLSLANFESYVGIAANLDTSSEQSNSLQVILNNSAFSNKRRIQIPEGRFSIRDVSIPSSSWLMGKGIDKTILQRAGALSVAILTFASGASDVTISDMTIDGLSASDTAALIRATGHGSRIRFERVKFTNGCQRWALRFDPAAQFSNLIVKDCIFDNCSQGCIIMLPTSNAVAGSSDIQIIGNTFKNCGANLCQIRGYGTDLTPAQMFKFDFFYNTKYNFNTVTNCQASAIPNELWSHNGLQQIGNYLDSGTRGLSGGEGQRNGVIAHNIICNQTLYAMEGGNNADNVHIHDNIAYNCATFYKETGAATTIARRVIIEDNLIVGSGLTAYNSVTPNDTIAIGNENGIYVTDCVIRNNIFRDVKWTRQVIRIKPDTANSNEVIVEGNRYLSSNYEDPVSFIVPTDCDLVSRNNFMRRAAAYDISHPAGNQQVCYAYGGRTSASGASVISENDSVEMAGAINSGSMYALGRVETAIARYGMRIFNFKAIGTFSSGPFYIADSTGTTILEGFDLRGLAAQAGLLTNINTSLALGLSDGKALLGSGGYVKAGPVGARRRVLCYEGGAATRTVKIRCDAVSGGEPQATFLVDFVCSTNNAAPSVNRVVVGFSSATAPASAPTMFQDNGTAATLASALSGALMEATITLPASNGTWLATITADAVGGAAGNGINDYSVRIA